MSETGNIWAFSLESNIARSVICPLAGIINIAEFPTEEWAECVMCRAQDIFFNALSIKPV